MNNKNSSTDIKQYLNTINQEFCAERENTSYSDVPPYQGYKICCWQEKIDSNFYYLSSASKKRFFGEDILVVGRKNIDGNFSIVDESELWALGIE